MAESENENVDYLKSTLARAVETHSDETIQSLNKNETLFYLCDVFGVEPPEAHPSEHNGTVPRSLSQQFARIMGDYVGRNGTDALKSIEEIEGGAEESDGDAEESDE